MAERPSSPSLIWQQIRYQNKIFWRTPVAAFFTLGFPLMFLVLFTAIFGNEVGQDGISTSQFFAPNLAVFSAVSASYTNLAIGTAYARDRGILKRVRGTPLPPWIYITGRIGSATYIAAIAIVVMMGVGVLVYGVQVPLRGIPGAVLAFMVGVGTFAALGLLVAALAPSGDSTPAITNASLLPLAFVSDIFFRIADPPRWMAIIGDLFPLKHFAIAFRDPLNPTLTGVQIHWDHLTYMALWGGAAVILAIRSFRWDPKEKRGRARGARSGSG
jgi:ABC-2 type transport system permease protein